MIIGDAATIAAQPVMQEDMDRQKLVRSFVLRRTPQGVEVVKIPPQWTWQVEPVKRLLESLSRPENWDSYSAHVVSSNAVEAAIAFIDMVPFDSPPRPRVVPLSTGGIQLEWTKGRRDLEIEFSPDGSIEYLSAEAGDVNEGRIPSLAPAHVSYLVSWLMAG